MGCTVLPCWCKVSSGFKTFGASFRVFRIFEALGFEGLGACVFLREFVYRIRGVEGDCKANSAIGALITTCTILVLPFKTLF